MESALVDKIRNYIVVVVLAAFVSFTFAVLWWGSGLVERAHQEHYEKLPELLARALVDPFLSLDYSTLNTAVNQLAEAGDEFSIAYIGFMDDRGRLFVSSINENLDSEVRSWINEERLRDREEGLLFPGEQWVEFEDDELGTFSFYELDVPVEFHGDRTGLIKIGYLPKPLTVDWATYRSRVFITGFVILLIIIVVFIFISQSWRDEISNHVSLVRNETEQKYKDKLNKLERKVKSQPLNSDEFFQIIDFGKRVNATMEPVETLRYLVNSVVKILGVKQVVVFLVSTEDSNVLVGQMGMKEGEWMDRSRLNNIKIEIGTGEIGTIAELGQANILDKPRPGAGVAAALRASGQTIGVVRATEKKSGARMGNKDKLKMRLITQLAGNIVKHAFEFQKLRKK